MGLFTKYKSNFKKQAGWIWANKFVYSHPNSKHLEFARCPLLISAVLVVAQAPSQMSASYTAAEKGRQESWARPGALHSSTRVSSMRGCAALCREDTEAGTRDPRRNWSRFR